jgi:hypothetical protein
MDDHQPRMPNMPFQDPRMLGGHVYVPVVRSADHQEGRRYLRLRPEGQSERQPERQWLSVLSMAARNSPESSGRNSPLHSDSVTAKSLRRSDIGEGIEGEIDDLLKRLGGDTVAQAFGQGVGPGGILAL